MVQKISSNFIKLISFLASHHETLTQPFFSRHHRRTPLSCRPQMGILLNIRQSDSPLRDAIYPSLFYVGNFFGCQRHRTRKTRFGFWPKPLVGCSRVDRSVKISQRVSSPPSQNSICFIIYVPEHSRGIYNFHGRRFSEFNCREKNIFQAKTLKYQELGQDQTERYPRRFVMNYNFFIQK